MRYNSVCHSLVRIFWSLPCGVWVLVLGLLGLCSNSGASAAERLAAESSSRLTQWTITYDGKPVMVYDFDPQKFKPFVKALNTLSGYGVLRDSPGDHLHHHALMYGIRVNGINFWEETTGCGVQKVVETSAPEISKNEAGQPQARLVQLLYWLAPEDAFLPNTNAPALLIERRTLTLTLNPKQRETALHWKSEFEVGSKTNVVTLTGANYHGLGMRFLRELDPLAVHLTPEGTPDLAGSRQDVSAHRWEAVAFDSPGKPATIALFGAASNARGEARYFSMKTPFAYLSATQGLDGEALVYRRGERFELNYLVTIHPELKSSESLAERGRQWGGSSQ
ncbi:exported hypothetical protein [Verrucomicrobia bacterium]|nr:exported hypothetical protein [Verrucomicrobiota bacterium]